MRRPNPDINFFFVFVLFYLFIYLFIHLFVPMQPNWMWKLLNKKYPHLESLYVYKANDRNTRMVCNTFKANNKYTRTTLRHRSGVLLIWAYFTPFSNHSIVNFKLVKEQKSSYPRFFYPPWIIDQTLKQYSFQYIVFLKFVRSTGMTTNPPSLFRKV